MPGFRYLRKLGVNGFPVGVLQVHWPLERTETVLPSSDPCIRTVCACLFEEKGDGW